MADDHASKFAKLKHNLFLLNKKKKNKKTRVTDFRLIASSYLSHVLPSSIGKFALAPFTRLSLFQQIGKSNNNIWHNGWKGVHLHLSVGLVYPAAKLLAKKIDYNTKNSLNSEDSLLKDILSTCFGFFIAYPLEVAYTHIALVDHKVTLKNYLKKTFNTQSLPGIYKGCSLGLLTALPYTFIASRINDKLQNRIKLNAELPNINIDGDLSCIDKSMIAKKLHPVSFYPWNIAAGSFSSFIALAFTYPLDTARRRYITDTSGRCEMIVTLKNTLNSGFRGMYSGFSTRSMIYFPYTLLYLCTYKPVINVLS